MLICSAVRESTVSILPTTDVLNAFGKVDGHGLAWRDISTLDQVESGLKQL